MSQNPVQKGFQHDHKDAAREDRCKILLFPGMVESLDAPEEEPGDPDLVSIEESLVAEITRLSAVGPPFMARAHRVGSLFSEDYKVLAGLIEPLVSSGFRWGKIGGERAVLIAFTAVAVSLAESEIQNPTVAQLDEGHKLYKNRDPLVGRGSGLDDWHRSYYLRLLETRARNALIRNGYRLPNAKGDDATAAPAAIVIEPGEWQVMRNIFLQIYYVIRPQFGK